MNQLYSMNLKQKTMVSLTNIAKSQVTAVSIAIMVANIDSITAVGSNCFHC